jgi:broad specificity phosphatase PhoE
MSETKTELWLIRHGETEWSKSGAHTGSSDIPLTDAGRVQAEALAPYLAEKHFDKVFVSPLGRARETCRLAGFPDAIVEPNLHEWNYGIYEGKSTKEIRVDQPGFSVWKDPIPQGEELVQVGERADAVIARMLAELPYGRAALFAHAHILRILAARWIGLSPDGGHLFALSTASVSTLFWERETRVISRWNHTLGE